jgi:hypothetical protein
MSQTITLSQIRDCTLSRWSPTIGDPTIWGWVTVAAYALCMILAIWVVKRAGQGRERQFWVMMALLMAFLAVNKELDLQTALTAMGRCIAQLQGWYELRQNVQRQFIIGLLAATLIGFVLGLILMRRHLLSHGLAILGLATVAGFVAVRAVGFHNFDSLINTRVMDLRLNFIFEVSGLILIALNAIALLVVSRRG